MDTRTSAAHLRRTRTELSDFLTGLRRRLAPADLGLPTTGRRRTPGLRREEVAQAAGVGLTWYTWFEQGRDIQVSAAFLLSVAKALRLDDAECAHLFLLAHRRPPPAEARQWPSVGPLVQRLLDDLALRPAFVLNLSWDVVAFNACADRLFGFSGGAREGRNLLRLVLTDPAWRKRLRDWHVDAERLVAQFHGDRAKAPDDPTIAALVEDLKCLSPDACWWLETRDMPAYARAPGAVLDNQGKRLGLVHETLIVDEHRHLRMVVCFEAESLTAEEEAAGGGYTCTAGSLA